MMQRTKTARIALVIAAGLMSVTLSGCLVRTAANVATLPVRAVSQTADWMTTSQSEADRNYGRKMRKQQARDARALKKQQREQARDAKTQPGS